jgi:hypothetical protein
MRFAAEGLLVFAFLLGAAALGEGVSVMLVNVIAPKGATVSLGLGTDIHAASGGNKWVSISNDDGSPLVAASLDVKLRSAGARGPVGFEFGLYGGGATVPEPTSVGIGLLGFIGLLHLRRKSAK